MQKFYKKIKKKERNEQEKDERLKREYKRKKSIETKWGWEKKTFKNINQQKETVRIRWFYCKSDDDYWGKTEES